MNDETRYADLTLQYLGRLKEFDPSQPRDDKGQWTGGGAGGSSGGSAGGDSGGSGESSGSDSYSKWKKGEHPRNWTEVDVRKGDKFNVIGRDNSPIMELTVTKPDSYKRFHTTKVSKIINSNTPDRDIADYFLDRERGGEIGLVDADLPHLAPARRASRK